MITKNKSCSGAAGHGTVGGSGIGSSRTGFIIKAAITAALYIVLTFIFAPFSYGPVQFRVSEALTVLPAVMPASIPGLFLGCALSNILFGGLGPVDLVFGSLATLIAALGTRLFRKSKWLAPLPPVIINGLVVGTYLVYLLPEAELLWPVSVASVMAGEAAVCYVLGLPLLLLIKRRYGNII